METGINIKMALGSDLIGMVLIIVMIFGNIWRLRLKNRESRVLIAMLVSCFSCCLSDILAFAVDGGTGAYTTFWVYLTNTWLFASNSLCAFSWFVFLKEHFKFELSATQRWYLLFTMLTILILLIFNFFYPILFSVTTQNQYSRRFGYWIFIAVNYGIIINSLILYFKNYRKDGFIRFFPIGLYVIPIVVATVAQSLFYGISLMAPSFAIAIAGAFTSLQNEQGFRDSLTGLFNRSFLDYALMLYSQKGKKASGVMISLRHFEKINEEYGHDIGDQALRKTAEILHESVGRWGSILRYSGDEFIIMFDSQFDEHIANCLEKLKMNFDKFNRTRIEPYRLTPAIGFKKFNDDEENVNSFLNGLKKAVNDAKKKMEGQIHDF